MDIVDKITHRFSFEQVFICGNRPRNDIIPSSSNFLVS